MHNTSSAARAAGQVNRNNPLYFIAARHGLRRYTPPRADVPFAVLIKGKWQLVYRAVTDVEFFAKHPDAQIRMTVRQLDPASPWAFRVCIAARDGRRIDCADNFDVAGALGHVAGGSPRERLKAAAIRMLGSLNLVQPIPVAA